jgi:hypothetical protein
MNPVRIPIKYGGSQSEAFYASSVIVSDGKKSLKKEHVIKEKNGKITNDTHKYYIDNKPVSKEVFEYYKAIKS